MGCWNVLVITFCSLLPNFMKHMLSSATLSKWFLLWRSRCLPWAVCQWYWPSSYSFGIKNQNYYNQIQGKGKILKIIFSLTWITHTCICVYTYIYSWELNSMRIFHFYCYSLMPLGYKVNPILLYLLSLCYTNKQAVPIVARPLAYFNVHYANMRKNCDQSREQI